MPTLPVSLTSSVILPYSLNAVTPNIGTGFDLGVEVHGLVNKKFGYEVGIFNGTGSSVNTATKHSATTGISHLYFMPDGLRICLKVSCPPRKEIRIVCEKTNFLFGLSSSLNVESESESTNDFRAGAEFAMLKNQLYLGAEIYYMQVGFTERQKIDKTYHYLGGYVQGRVFRT